MEDKKQYNFGVSKFAQIELPKFSETKKGEWINFGEDNMFPEFIIGLSKASALHSAIISAKVNQTLGCGFNIENVTDNRTLEYVENANEYETLNDVFTKVVYDFVLFGGAYLNLIYSKDKKTVYIYHIPFQNVRAGKKNENNIVDMYYYSECWGKYRQSEYAPKPIPAYSKNSKELSMILPIFEYKPGNYYYPLPSYVGGLTAIATDAEIANFWLAQIKNGMRPSAMLNFVNGIPSDDEMREIEKNIERKFTGTDNGGRFLLNFSEDKDRVPIFTPITQSDIDKTFIQLQDSVMQNILSAHKTTPQLVGIAIPGKLGNGTLMEEFQIFDNTVIKPAKKVIQTAFEKVFKLNNIENLEIGSVAPVEFTWSESLLEKIMTPDELREKIGLQPLPTQNNIIQTQ